MLDYTNNKKDIFMFEFLPVSILKQILFYPWLELKYEVNAFFIENKHTVRSTFRIFSITLTSCLGVCLFFNNPAIEFIPTIFQAKVVAVLAALFSSHVGAYTSKVIARIVCDFRFGDPEFFLTNKRAKELVELFQAQGIQLEEHGLQEIVKFCVHNLRENYSSEIGCSPKDWEHILNALIYDANINPFLEQQEALTAIRNQRISIRPRNIIVPNYTASSSSHQSMTVLPPAITTYNRNRASPNLRI